MKKIEGKKYLDAPTPPEDEVIGLFAGLLSNPDMSLSRLDIQFQEDGGKVYGFPGGWSQKFTDLVVWTSNSRRMEAKVYGFEHECILQ